MTVIKTALGWEIQPETSDEESRLQWLIEALQDHRGQQHWVISGNATSTSTHNTEAQ